MGCCQPQKNNDILSEIIIEQKKFIKIIYPQNPQKTQQKFIDINDSNNRETYQTYQYIVNQVIQNQSKNSNNQYFLSTDQENEEEQQEDFLRTTHINTDPLDIEIVRQNKIQNEIIMNRISSQIEQKKTLEQNELQLKEKKQSNQLKASKFIPLEIIKQQESISSTIRKTANYLSISQHSQPQEQKK